MKRYCFALDLVPDERLIAEYEALHRNVWPAILESIRESGITSMQIYRTGNRMLMYMETTDDFSLERKAEMDAANPVVQEWETLMWKYQQAIPGVAPGVKWVMMDEIFSFF